MRAGLFPGQGVDAKVVLNGLDPTHPTVGSASETLGYDLVTRVTQIAKRPRGVLPTSLAQPAIFVAGLIAFEARAATGERFDCLVGHSLGEYTALVAARAIGFEDGLKLVAARGEAMQRATGASSGGMAAVLGLALPVVEEIARTRGLTVANDNSPAQVVLSGDRERLAHAAEAARELGGRCVLLSVEGAFHSGAMSSATEALVDALSATHIRSPAVPVVSNVTARPYRAPGEIRKLLVRQLTGRVRFREAILFLVDRNVGEFVDIGPGDVVGRLARACAHSEKESAVV